MRRLLVITALVSGCGLLEELETVEESCEHQAWYPDADGDGLGEPSTVYIGCQPPEGWVTEAHPADTGAGEANEDTGDSGE